MEPIVRKTRFIELLQHHDLRVRNESAEALGRFFSGTEGVISSLLDAIRNYPAKCLGLAVNLSKFHPAGDDIPRILELYHNSGGSKDNEALSLRYHTAFCLYAFPFERIEPHQRLFEADRELRKLYESLQACEEVCRKPFDELWEEFHTLCWQKDAQEEDRERAQLVELLCRGLARYPEQLREPLVAILNEDDPDNYLLEEYLVPLAGELKIEESTPALFKIFTEVDVLANIHESAKVALGKIGTRQVLEETGRLYAEREDLRIDTSEILKHMPYSEAEDCALHLLRSEQDLEARTFIAGSLCDIFSIRAADSIKALVENRQYDPTIMSLIDHLIPVYAYHGQEADLSELEERDKEFREQQFHEGPLSGLRQELNEALERLAAGRQPKMKRPVSQKKGKAAQKRTKKRKKKKR